MCNQLENTCKKEGRTLFLLVASLFCLFYAPLLFAQVPTLDEALTRLRNNIPELMRLVTAFAYVTGFYLVIAGIIELKHFGEMRTQMSHEHSLKKPLLYIFIGSALIFLPSSIATGLYTLWEQPAPYAYQVAELNPWSRLVDDMFIILQFLGVLAFIRGLLMLTHSSGHGGQQGNFAKGLTHIIGGILCINMYDTIRMVLATFGLDTVFS